MEVMLLQGVVAPLVRLGNCSGPESTIENLCCRHGEVTWSHPSLAVFSMSSASNGRQYKKPEQQSQAPLR